MKPSKMISIEHEQAEMWQLSADRRSVRMDLPELMVEGWPAPIRVKMYFDASVVDGIIERLLVLRLQMLPAPARASERH